MTEEERVRRNEAIARFLGWRDPFLNFPQPRLWVRDDGSVTHSIGFHRDWVWLARAIEGISHGPELEFAVMRKGDGGWLARIGLRVFPGTTMIEAAWMAVSSYCLHFENPAPDGK